MYNYSVIYRLFPTPHFSSFLSDSFRFPKLRPHLELEMKLVFRLPDTLADGKIRPKPQRSGATRFLFPQIWLGMVGFKFGHPKKFIYPLGWVHIDVENPLFPWKVIRKNAGFSTSCMFTGGFLTAHTEIRGTKMVLGSAGLLVMDSATKGCLSEGRNLTRNPHEIVWESKGNPQIPWFLTILSMLPRKWLGNG